MPTGPLFGLPDPLNAVSVDPATKVTNALMQSGQKQLPLQPRVDGSKKGSGWLGLLARPDGNVSSEISVGVPINGKETTIPLLVPTLDPSEVNWLLNTDPQAMKTIPESILRKAVTHAEQRMLLQQSPFVD